MNVLVVEDDSVLRVVLKHFFTLKEHHLILSKDGEDALLILEKVNKPDLIITDIMMPRMNGYEMITAIKSKPDLQDIPVIIITAGKIDLLKYTSSGANEMFQKPIPLDQLLEKAEELVSFYYQQFKK
jgi:CheY-like chemotaxis protein